MTKDDDEDDSDIAVADDIASADDDDDDDDVTACFNDVICVCSLSACRRWRHRRCRPPIWWRHWNAILMTSLIHVCPLVAGAEMTEMAEKLNYDREVIRVWFCNKRQALKNTIKRLKSDLP